MEKELKWFNKGKKAGYRRGFSDGAMLMLIGTMAMVVGLKVKGL